MRKGYRIGIALIFTLVALLVAPFFGATWIPLSEVLSGNSSDMYHQIFWQLRLPRACFAFLAGAALAVGGVVFQALFRNFLASPFTLGVASGAAFGATMYFNLGLSFALFGLSGSAAFGMIGACLTIAPIYLLTRTPRGGGSTEILLAGVVISLFFSSLIVFLQYISDFAGILRITRWLMGGFEVVGFDAILGMLPFVIVGLLVIVPNGLELNLMTLGDDVAHSRGVRVHRTRMLLMLVTSLMIGGVVSFCGPISSVGVMAPHICRMLIGYDHRHLVPAAFLGGGAFVVVCDTLARTIIAPYEIPVGVVTALLEGPFLLWLIYRRRINAA